MGRLKLSLKSKITSRLRLAECWRRLWSASKQPPLLCTTLSWRLQPLLLWMLLLLFSCKNWTQLFDIFSCIFWYHGRPLLYSIQEKYELMFWRSHLTQKLSFPIFQADGGSNSIPALQKWKEMDRNQDFKLDQEEIAYYLGWFRMISTYSYDKITNKSL